MLEMLRSWSQLQQFIFFPVISNIRQGIYRHARKRNSSEKYDFYIEFLSEVAKRQTKYYRIYPKIPGVSSRIAGEKTNYSIWKK